MASSLRWMPIGATILLAIAGCANANGGNATQSNTQDTATAASIGTASEEADGTIVLNLRVTGANGAVGDGQFRYPKTHPHYAMIKAHVGPIPKGRSVQVKPFPHK